jgi:hypothetical protein
MRRVKKILVSALFASRPDQKRNRRFRLLAVGTGRELPAFHLLNNALLNGLVLCDTIGDLNVFDSAVCIDNDPKLNRSPQGHILKTGLEGLKLPL